MANKLLGSYAGVPITNHDVKGETDPEERRGYRILEYIAGALIVIFALMSIFRVPSEMGPGLWWAFSLLAAGYFLTFLPIAFPRRRPYETSPGAQSQFDPTRLDTFWYERNVADVTDEEVIDIEDETPPSPEDEDDDRPLP
jgi:hypothetical protein